MKLYTAAAVGRWLDLTERRIRQLRDQGILEEKRPGLYNLKDCVIKYIQYLRRDGSSEESTADYNAERARLAKVKRERQELELRREQREVLEAEEVETVMSDMMLGFQKKIRVIPVKLSPALAREKDPSEIFKILKQATDEALEELAGFAETFETQGEDNGSIRKEDLSKDF